MSLQLAARLSKIEDVQLQQSLRSFHMVRYLVALAFVVLTMFGSATAAEFGTKDEAVAMVKRVQEQFKKDGPELTFKAVSDKNTKEYHDRDLYPFIYDMRGSNKGLNVAHGARPALIGKNLIDLKDQDGKYLIREMVDIASGPGSGWVNYKWPNPTTNKIEDKSSYIEKMGDYLVGVGAYR
jgi:signal transduction histidine kinase